jgi:hypothetical protein
MPGGDSRDAAELEPQISGGFKQACEEQHYSTAELECVIAADDLWSIGRCSPQATPPGPLAAPGTDTSCAAVGTHLSALVMQQISDLDAAGLPADVRAELTAADFPGQVEATCTTAQWSDECRSCMIAATTLGALAACP